MRVSRGTIHRARTSDRAAVTDRHHAVLRDERRTRAALVIISVFLAAEVITGLLAHSLVLLSDAGHMLTDVGSLVLAIGALRLAERPPSDTFTYGLRRSEVLSAAINGIVLVAIGVAIAVEAVVRLLHPSHVDGGVVLVVATTGVVVNATVLIILRGADRHRMSVRAAVAHVVTDVAASFATVVAAIVIVTTHVERADAVASLCVVALIGAAAWGVLRDSGRILLQASPADLDLDVVRRHLAEVDHVRHVHDLHAWTLTSGAATLSAHVVIEDHCFVEGHAPQVLDALQNCLVTHFGVEHATLQLEPDSHAGHEPGTHT